MALLRLPFLTTTATTTLLTIFLLLILTLHTHPTTSKKLKTKTDSSNPPKNAILLSKVHSLTLHSSRLTTHRRLPAIPQLTCTSTPSSICNLYTIDTMRCTNEGADYDAENIQWACRAELPEEFKLGGTEVVCEGYESAEDEWVLRGSCAVEYRLLLTEKGEERFGGGGGGFGDGHGGDGEGSSLFVKVLFFVVFGGVVLVILSGFLRACWRSSPRLGGGTGGGGAGGGGGGYPPWYGGGPGDDDVDDPPPPPYDSHGYAGPPPKKTARSAGTRSSSGGSSAGRPRQPSTQRWRPGPVTAGLVGAGLGYALGRGQDRAQAQPRQNVRQGGFFGNGGGPSSSSSPSMSSPTYSTSRTSTGFGGTSRR